MLFSSVLMNIPNSKVCLKEESLSIKLSSTMLNIVDNIVGSKTLFNPVFLNIATYRSCFAVRRLVHREQIESDFAYLLSKLFIELVFAVVYELENINAWDVTYTYYFFNLDIKSPSDICLLLFQN